MARKVFLSFLGTNAYTKCVYSFCSIRSNAVEYVQSALIEMFCTDWTEKDKIFVFITKEAEEKNWERLKQEWHVNTAIIKGIHIPSGKNEEEIWQIFQILYDALEKSDELYVDITHSFRSIPLLASSLLQYAKFLKNISVQGIYYGAFETLGNPRDILDRIPNAEERIAPVFDLTAFSKIQDWSVAANDFIRFGNTSRLSQLTKGNIYSVLRESKGQNQVASALNRLNQYIDELSLNIKTNRGKKIIEGEAPDNIIHILNSLEQDLIRPLNPILSDLKKSVNDIYNEKGNTKNMLLAVKWCIEKQLIQEGFTILQEGIISFLLIDYRNKDKREYVSGFLNRFFSGTFDRSRFKLNTQDSENLEEHLGSIPGIEKWSSIFKKITDYRNDINHAGMTDKTIAATAFESKLKELYEQTERLLSC
ncbi:MAG: TIGR02221 family CRISPR-associated protein [Candidatus Azobacteroides sp.]|nr:TIGR02221 family CRISPR-associated protein [Candidatus Azobacteroides sp.]